MIFDGLGMNPVFSSSSINKKQKRRLVRKIFFSFSKLESNGNLKPVVGFTGLIIFGFTIPVKYHVCVCAIVFIFFE
jgi:hypothetical protein